MLKDRRTDMLLTIARYGLRFAIVVMGLTILIALCAVVALLFFPSQGITEQLAAAPAITLPVIFVVVAIATVMLTLSIRFALELGRIVRTVQQGDPFEPANADRLARMGWLTLGVTISGWLLRPLVLWLEQHFEELSVGNGPELSGLVLSATLFILARVFRHGAAMRDDLQGTV
jgi:hypothetical protein